MEPARVLLQRVFLAFRCWAMGLLRTQTIVMSTDQAGMSVTPFSRQDPHHEIMRINSSHHVDTLDRAQKESEPDRMRVFGFDPASHRIDSQSSNPSNAAPCSVSSQWPPAQYLPDCYLLAPQ